MSDICAKLAITIRIANDGVGKIVKMFMPPKSHHDYDSVDLVGKISKMSCSQTVFTIRISVRVGKMACPQKVITINE